MTDASSTEIAGSTWRCPSCGELNAADALSCAFCAAPRREMPVSDARPVSRRASLALRFALLPFAVNILTNIVERALDGAYPNAAAGVQVVLSLVAVAILLVGRIAVITLAVLAVVFAVRAWPETAPTGEFRGRGRLIWVFILAGLHLVGLFVTFFLVVPLV